jgi:sigma-E factor negative regulatory protein RseA
MSEQIREQVSAFLDGELPKSETELLLKRLTRDAQLREGFGRYALIGEAIRGGGHPLMTRDFAARVNLAIDGEPVQANGPASQMHAPRWWRPFAGVAVAAGVAAIAVVALQQRADAPGVRSAAAITARSAAPQATAPNTMLARSAAVQTPPEALSYTVPVASGAAPAAMPAARLTNYVLAHSRYSSGLDQRGVVADMLIEAEEQPPSNDAAAHVAP